MATLGVCKLPSMCHQLLLNGNVTAITANLLLGSWNKVILAFCISFHFMGNGQNRPKCAKIRGKLVVEIGFLEGFWENLTKSQPAKPVETGKSLI